MSNTHNISANALFHFTNSLENIQGILENEFKPNFRKEEFTFSSVRPSYYMHIPMVCFCDLPLSQVKNHIAEYGGYGIGMTKEWGITSGLNPIIYLQKNTLLSNVLTEVGNHFFNNSLDFETDHGYQLANRLRSFIKPYEGTDSKGVPKRFYDEREWRFIPETVHGFPDKYFSKNADLLKNEIGKTRLPFEPKNIKYIIVKSTEEIYPMIQYVQEIKGRKYSYEEIMILASRILVSDDIMIDF